MSGERRIVAAAIYYDSGLVLSVPAPGRHADVLRRAVQAGIRERVESRQMGFLTSRGKWVNRARAESIARAAGQIEGDLIGSVLTSEDLW